MPGPELASEQFLLGRGRSYEVPAGLGEEAESEPSTLWPQPLDKGACLLTLTLRIRKGWASLPPHPHPHLEMTFCGVIPLNPKLSGVTTGFCPCREHPSASR